MQFLPSSSSSSVSALGGVALATGGNGVSLAAEKGNEFLDTLNRKLAESGVTPIVDAAVKGELPKGFRTIKRDASSKLDGEDISQVIASLKKRGVDDSALTGIEGLLSSGSTPTIGTIMGVVGKQGRSSEELTDEEYQQLLSAFQKLQFTQDESEELIGLMQNGRGAEAMRTIKNRVASMGQESLALSKGEVKAIMRGLDLSAATLEKIDALLAKSEDGEFSGKTLEDLFGPATHEFALKKAEKEKLADEIKNAINDALEAKKVRAATESVTDTRGSRKSERAETRMLDDLTAKTNSNLKTDEGLDEEATLDDEHATRDEARQRSAQENERTVAALAGDKDKATSGTEKSSQAKEAFATVTNRIDVAAGMTAPTQSNTAATQPNTATTLANRQEIFSQVEQSLLRQLQDGSRQMTLRLDPAELGQISVLLTVKAGEVRAVIRTENAETTSLLSEQMSQLRATLEEQGLKVAQLDVETQLPQDTTKEQWSGMSGFNQEQEMREQARFLQLAKLRRESGTNLAQDMQSKGIQEEISPNGLHIIA